MLFGIYPAANAPFALEFATISPVVKTSQNPPWMFGHAPNISGSHRAVVLAGGGDGSSGAFDFYTGQGVGKCATAGTDSGTTTFDANRCSSVYNTNGGLQPKALQTLPCIRF